MHRQSGYLVAAVAGAGVGVFAPAAGLAVLALVVAGAVRVRYIRKSAGRSAQKMIAVGVAAGGAAFVVGWLASRLIG